MKFPVRFMHYFDPVEVRFLDQAAIMYVDSNGQQQGLSTEGGDRESKIASLCSAIKEMGIDPDSIIEMELPLAHDAENVMVDA